MVFTYLGGGWCVCSFNSWHFHRALRCSKGFCGKSFNKMFNFLPVVNGLTWPGAVS